MKPHPEAHSRPSLEALNAAIRAAHLNEAEVAASGTAVWNRIAADLGDDAAGAPAAAPEGPVMLRGCADMRALAPAYQHRRLAPELRLLVEDHLASCVACRRAFAGRPPLMAETPALASPATRRPALGWAAVALAVAAAIAVAVIYVRVSPRAGQATVLAAGGPLYQLGTGGPARVQARWLDYGPRYRNAAQTQLQLPDGSRLDLRAHSEFAFSANGAGTRIHLIAGDVIVEAAHQTGGRHLQVVAPGAVVTSLGTIFAVQQGLKGARVAVLRGSVRVNVQGRQSIVPAGGQLSTNPDLPGVPLASDFAWGANAPHYLALVASLARLRRALAQVPPPQLRYGSALAQLLPANTAFFASLPNLHGQLSQSYQILQSRLQQDPVLRAWWQHRNPSATKMESALQPILALGADLGPEIVIAASADAHGAPTTPLLLARVLRPRDFQRRLRQLTAPATFAGGSHAPHIVSGNQLPPAMSSGPVIWLHHGLLAAALSPAPLRRLQAGLLSAAPRFTTTPFYGRIAHTYAAGVSVLVAANVHPWIQRVQVSSGAEWPSRLGLANATAFIATVRQTGSVTANRAVLAFGSPRQGVAAMLSEPQPMVGLSYVSPQPRLVVAADTIPPARLAAEIMQLQAGPGRPPAAPPAWLRSLLAPLSGEFVIALDGPMLPSPNWVFSAAVNDPAAMQSAIASALAPMGGGVLTPVTVNGRDAYRLSLPFGFHLVYLYTGGDLVAAANSAWLTQALRYHSSSYNLLHSQRFLAALPMDDQVNCSAIFYQDLGPALNSLLSLPGAGQIGAAQRQSIASLASQAPTAACAYAAPQSLTLAMNGTTGPLEFFEHSLIGAHALDFGPFSSVLPRHRHAPPSP
ncbi:MAG: FecR domain-containing protein [Terriglobales bacterium]